MQPQPRIAAIIVNYGTADLAIQAVNSVLRQPPGTHLVEVHLVDNASPGDDAERLRAAHSAQDWGDRVTLWAETENHGFGRGNNVVLHTLAASQDPPDKIFLLNPDAWLENEVIDMLASALDANPGAGGSGASVLRPDWTPVTSAFRFPGPASEFARVANLDRLFGGWRMSLPPNHPAGPVDWISGACVMFRFRALAEINFFDPGFFLYFEEVDLMRRLQEAGWKMLYVPQAKVIHKEGAATGQFAGTAARKRDPDYLYDSWAYYFSRAYGRAGALKIALLLWIAGLINILHLRLRGRSPTVSRHFLRDHGRRVVLPLLTGAYRRR